MASLLDEPARFDTEEWDGNDFSFMQAVTGSLRAQLDRVDALAR